MGRQATLRCWLLCLCAVLACPSLHAHPYSVMWLHLRVSKEKVRAVLTLTVEEFYYRYNLEVGLDYSLPEKTIRESMERHKSQILKHLRLYDVDRKLLKGRITDVQLLERLEKSMPMSEQVRYALEYPLEMPLASLIISQDFDAQDGMVPTTICVKVTQAGHETRKPLLLDCGVMQTLDFDWLTPPPTSTAPSPEQRERERQERLGITNYGAAYSFVYIEPDEVRRSPCGSVD